MPAAAIPNDELGRQAELDAYGVLDTPSEPEFDRLTRLAAQILDVPIALVSLVDRDRQWFKSRVGLDAREIPRDQAFCAHAIHEHRPLLVPDALNDPRFADNPLVLGDPRIRFYVGAPLVAPSGHVLGTICGIDREPRKLAESQIAALEELSRIAVDELELRLRNATLRDLTARLVRSNEDLTQFAYAVSHDLRTPLRHMSGFAKLLSEQCGERLDDEHRGWLEHIVSASSRMNSMIEDLLRLAQVDGGQEPLETVSMQEVLDATLELLDPSIDEAGAVVTASALPIVRAHRAQMQQLFSNLIENAIKYRDAAPPRIHVQAEESALEWKLSVRDNGVGIDASDRERIFAVFRRTSGAGGAEAPGNGIGLALCKRIVERHGGRIWVEPVVPRGSVFHCTLARHYAENGWKEREAPSGEG